MFECIFEDFCECRQQNEAKLCEWKHQELFDMEANTVSYPIVLIACSIK